MSGLDSQVRTAVSALGWLGACRQTWLLSPLSASSRGSEETAA
jgi:hypothetical protein